MNYENFKKEDPDVKDPRFGVGVAITLTAIYVFKIVEAIIMKLGM